MDYFDLHCDTPYECYEKKQDFLHNELAVSGENGAAFDRWTQCFAVWLRDDCPAPYRLYRAILADFKEKLRDCPSNLTPVFTVEGGAVLEDQPDRLDALRDDGVRALTLTWNGKNRIAGGSASDGTLTHYGKQVIRRMNGLHIACDLSHLNDRSFSAALDEAAFPLATHSNCRVVCEHPRNLTDDRLKALCARGGIVGLCFYPLFLGGDVREKLWENIRHLSELGLEDHIAVGSDFDGAAMAPELSGIAGIPAFRAFLAGKGLDDGFLQKIFYENARNFFSRL